LLELPILVIEPIFALRLIGLSGLLLFGAWKPRINGLLELLYVEWLVPQYEKNWQIEEKQSLISL